MSPENKNPIQDKYDKDLGPDFDPLKKAEKKGTAGVLGGGKKGAASSMPGIGGVKKAEENAGGGWKNNVGGAGGAVASALKPGGFAASMKKKGPLFAIILTVVGGGFGIVGMLTPSLLIVQFKEVMVNKFNTQLASMDVRNTKLLAKKMGVTKGLCTSPASILCKYSTMSEKQVEKFEKAGIHVVSDGDKTLLGRVKPKSFKYGKKKILAKNFSSEIGKNPEFRSAVKLAYNPKFAGFADAIWVKAAAKLGISKKAADIGGSTKEERLKKVQDATKNPAAQDAAPTERVPSVGDDKPPDGSGNKYTQADIDAINERNAAAEALNDVSTAAETAEKNAVKAAPAVLTGAKSVINTLKITGLMDNACTVYGTIRAVGYAAKTVRVLQLARYAMIYLNVADQIKAGTAKSEDVAYLGTVLSTEFISVAKDSNGNEITSRKNATNSFGYNYASTGHRGKMSLTSSQFLAGGGLAGDMINATSKINSILGGTPQETCGVLNNPFVSIGSLIGGVALFFIPGAQPAIGAWDAAKAAAGIALNIATAFLPALLQDIVAGTLVDKTTVGEAAGDAITSGSSGIMSTAAKTGGNAPLTPSQAVAYSNLSSNIAAQYAQEDQLAYSPLDANNNNTFMGKMVGKLVPYFSNMSSFSGIFSSITSITTGSFASLTTQTANATSTAEYKMCQDEDYKAMGLATDPYCNVTYGIPPEALKADPIEVANTLIDSGQIDPESGDPAPGSDYEAFVAECIDRATPLGDKGSGNTDPDGSACIFGADFRGTPNNNYYIHYIDQRVQAGLDGEEVAPVTEAGSTDPAAIVPKNNLFILGGSIACRIKNPGMGNIDVTYKEAGWNLVDDCKEGRNFQDALEEAKTPTAPTTAQDIKNANVIVIPLGANNLGDIDINEMEKSGEIFTTHMKELYDYLHSVNPTAKYYWVNYGLWGYDVNEFPDVENAASKYTRMKYINKLIRDFATKNSIKVVNWSNESDINDYRPDGGVHPSKTVGLKHYAKFLLEELGPAPVSATGRPANVVDAGKGWTLKNGFDYSNVPCAPGSEDNGIYTHPTNKYKIRLCKSDFDDSYSAAKGKGHFGVVSLLSYNLVGMLTAAKQDGINIRGSGFRTYEEQLGLWNDCAPNCGGYVAQPGSSNHERGIALDVRVGGLLICHEGSSKADCAGESGEQVRVYEWLKKHADTYGIYKLSIEAWHWSTSGG